MMILLDSFLSEFAADEERRVRLSDSAFQDIIVHDISVSNIRYL